ncbi:hypothetical protein [Streptomyces sp. ADI93-02]|uniref:hypothetical protein n=1 Tax=Streptomyces sp. ADI93-02 TaxID=1522757 RepID=UPI000F54CD3E|nr:hypothetical protein [Streptomyces sp. ADI93-02]RPK32141.1 hypothetical protein EES40_36805 [Streptomyces sp. ADI93-02]
MIATAAPSCTAVLIADDGVGASALLVTVQRWRPGSRSGVSGEVQWDAGALHRDGLRIQVSELNTTAFGLPITRETPVPSEEQLAGIVVSSRWKSGPLLPEWTFIASPRGPVRQVRGQSDLLCLKTSQY